MSISSPLIRALGKVPTWHRLRRRQWFGLQEIDERIAAHIKNRDGYYVELGAHDGVFASNTMHFELHRGWKGLLIEPAEENFRMLRKNRRKSRNAFANCACVSFDFPEEEIEMIYAHAWTIAPGISSSIEDHSAHAASADSYLRRGEMSRTFTAKAVTLTKLLQEAGAPRRIDLLSLDVEGAELEVLRGIDFTQFRFDWIILESRDPEPIFDLLSINRYELVEVIGGHDFLLRDASNKGPKYFCPPS